MKYMLDTNICIYIIKKQPIKILHKLRKLNPNDIVIAAITFAELCYGVEKSKFKQQNWLALQETIMPIEIVTFDANAAKHYAEIRAKLEIQGTPIGALDMLIAAQARSLNSILVTNNIKKFTRVPNLQLENWI